MKKNSCDMLIIMTIRQATFAIWNWLEIKCYEKGLAHIHFWWIHGPPEINKWLI